MNIVIIEDHLMFREAIRKACIQECGFQVVAETDSGLVGVEQITVLRPHVAILDLSLPDMDGFRVLKLVRHVAPATRILVLSAYSGAYSIFRAGQAGAHGFIDKGTNCFAHLKEGLQAVAAGKRFFPPVPEAASTSGSLPDPRSLPKILSATEQNVLSLIARGWDNVEISEKLHISPRTAQTHRSNILHKLQVKSTPKLIAFAVEQGLAIGRFP